MQSEKRGKIEAKVKINEIRNRKIINREKWIKAKYIFGNSTISHHLLSRNTEVTNCNIRNEKGDIITNSSKIKWIT